MACVVFVSQSKIMKITQLIFVLMTGIFVVGCSNNTTNTAQDTPLFARYENIRVASVDEYKQLAESGNYTIIDLRTAEELLPENGGKIFEEAINIDFYDPNFDQKIEQLDRTKGYLTYCRSGNRSGQALEVFREKGFMEVIDLQGGKISWDKAQ